MNDIDRLNDALLDQFGRLTKMMSDLDALAARVAALEIAPYKDMVSASHLDVLAKRVAALEGQGSRSPRVASPEAPRTGLRADSARDTVVGSDVPNPAPPAPLVERICLIFHKQQSPVRPGDCEMAKEALLVAAEELLTEITLDEWDDACTRYGSNAPGATTNGVLRSRLARAKEAAK